VVKQGHEKSCYELFAGKITTALPFLIQFGRIGYVTIWEKIRKKLTDKTVKCLCLAIAADHTDDCYRLYNRTTKKVILSRDVCWAEWERSTPEMDITIFEDPQTTSSEIDDELDDFDPDTTDDPAAAPLPYDTNNDDATVPTANPPYQQSSAPLPPEKSLPNPRGPTTRAGRMTEELSERPDSTSDSRGALSVAQPAQGATRIMTAG
jgi:hypothetical protein